MSESHDAVWAALAHPLRRRVLDALADGAVTTGEVVAAVDADRFVVMQHLKVLRESGLVHTERRGRERVNRLDSVPLHEAVGRWMSRYEQDWAAALVGLRDTVERSRDQHTPARRTRDA